MRKLLMLIASSVPLWAQPSPPFVGPYGIVNVTGGNVPGLGSFTFEYRDGLLSALVDAGGNSTSLSRDGIDRLLTVSNPLGQSQRMQYDLANRVTSVLYPSD